MKHFALTDAGNIRSVVWPPRWYYFDPAVFPEVTKILPGAEKIKETNTELRNWPIEQLSSAWESYTTDMGVSETPVPDKRDLFFSAYLYAKQELGFSQGKLDTLGYLWKNTATH